MTVRMICQSRFHPFKQKWYNYDPTGEYDSDTFCLSCGQLWRTALMLVTGIIVTPRESLYGNKMIAMDRQTAHEVIDAAFDQYEKEGKRNG